MVLHLLDGIPLTVNVIISNLTDFWLKMILSQLMGRFIFLITKDNWSRTNMAPVEDYRITSRGGLGIRNYMVTDKTGPIVGIKVVDGTEDLLLVTESGILIRTPVQNIRTAGRATQGVIVMRFKTEGDRVISMALADPEGQTPSAEE